MGPKKLLLIGGGLWSLLVFQAFLIERLAAKEGIDINDEEALKEWANRRVRESGRVKFYRDILLQRAKKE